MKKFNDSEIYKAKIGSLANLPDIMRNQNEMFDFLKELFPIEMRHEPKNEIANSTG